MGTATGTMPGSPMAWGVTQAEWDRHYPSDDRLRPGWMRMLRAVPCAAPPDAVWPWLCQIQVAPYSYDLLDNWGHRSPRSLTPGLTDLTVGQDFMTIFRLEEFVAGSRLTLSMKPGTPTRMFGAGWITYAVEPAGHGSRLVGALAFPERHGVLGAVSNTLLPWGDLVMMRKQLLTLANLALGDAQVVPRLEP
jgi:hypothetical protein